MTLTINESRSYHHELINELRPGPCVYKVGDHVLSQRSVNSNKATGVVDKTGFAFTGPWEVTKMLKDT